MNYQTDIIDVMDTLGYPINRRGLCFGITSMARQALFAGDLKTFDARIKRIRALCDPDQITTFEERFHSLEQEKKTDLRAFFDGVALYQKLPVSSEVLPERYNQFHRDAAQFVTPTALEHDPPAIVTSDCFVFKSHEDHFNRWLDSLERILQSEFAIELSSSNHMIVISYDQREKHWILINPNLLPSQTFVQIPSLIKNIHEAFDFFRISKNILFNATLFTKKSDCDAVAAQLPETEWDRMKAESLKHARSTDVCGANLCYLSALAGDLPLATALTHSEIPNLSSMINQRTASDLTPLMMAVLLGHLAIVQHFIEKGAEIDSAKEDGTTPLFIAAEMGHLAIVERLLQEEACVVDQAKHNGCTPIFVAAQMGHLAIIDRLIEKKASVDEPMKNGCRPLYLAAQMGHLAIVKRFVEHGADVNSGMKGDYAPLLIASEMGHLEIVEYLIEHGAEVNLSREDGCTALYFAAQSGHLSVVERLIEEKAVLDKPTNEGQTPLDVARQLGHLEVVKRLIEGVSIDVPYLSY